MSEAKEPRHTVKVGYVHQKAASDLRRLTRKVERQSANLQALIAASKTTD